MKPVMSLLLALFPMTVAVAQDAAKSADLTDPKEIFKKADDATKAVDAVKYNSESKSSNVPEQFAQFMPPNGKGSAVAQEKTAQGYKKSRVEAKFEASGSREERNLVAGTDGNDYYLVDHGKKMVYVDIDPAVQGSGRVAMGLIMREFGHPTPFSDEINGEKHELRPSVKVGDQDCYQVYVKYAGNQGEAVWYFSKKDFLPRRVDRMFSDPQNPTAEPSSTTLTLTDLTVNPTFAADPFKLTVPEGYTKSDDFAP